jgi:hypothetical protein
MVKRQTRKAGKSGKFPSLMGTQSGIPLNTEVKNSPSQGSFLTLYLAAITKIFDLRTLRVLKLKI